MAGEARRTSRGAEVDVFDHGGLAQARFGEAIMEPAVLALGHLAIHQQAESLAEAELLDAGHLQLLLERPGHAGQAQGLELVERRVDQHTGSSSPP